MVQISLPRKGTETSRSDTPAPFHPGSNLITPQGDGNRRPAQPCPLFLTGSNLITPQGDGNMNRGPGSGIGAGFKSHYPARGRKHSGWISRTSATAFKSHYPARGRKHSKPNASERNSNWFKSHYPARGRKLLTTGCAGADNQFKSHYPARGRKPLQKMLRQ